MALENRIHLAPPMRVIDAAKAVMGAIDFDPWSSKDINKLVCSAKFIDREKHDLDSVLAQDWDVPGEQRVFVAPAHGAQWSRRLCNKTLREYRKGRITQAVLWLSHNESLTKLPWIWEFPVCIPFRRLRPCYFDDEVESFRPISPSAWTAVVYLPPTDPQEFHTKLSRFYNAFFSTGPVIFNEMSGENNWEKAYEVGMKKKYNYYD
tara:strand:+ start:409 stop:1026 length:618 start_codon:yes stop_codon:yes gene_type:complete